MPSAGPHSFRKPRLAPLRFIPYLHLEMQERTTIKGMTRPELRQFVESIGERSFRAEQLFRWMYARGVRSFRAMTDLSDHARNQLEEIADLGNLTLESRQLSTKDGTTKLLFRLADGALIETVLIPAERESGKEVPRLTLCLSTQVGCPLDCKFCATGTMGFTRNLSAGEIVDQVLIAQHLVSRRITNLVYMGMGEPMLNYDQVMKSVEILTDDHALNIGWKHVTISTAGYADHIRRMADEKRKGKLAVSLHSLVDEQRLRIMPINKKYPLNVLLDAVEYYYRKTRQRPTFEYILFDGFNDSSEDAGRLIELTKRIPSKINLIPFHSVAGLSASLKPTPQDRIEEFARRLRREHVTVMVRSSAGEDIAAACGQLAVTQPGGTQTRDRRRSVVSGSVVLIS
jgi:23S rRNA (adenine2503-C2)-methyltransferase